MLEYEFKEESRLDNYILKKMKEEINKDKSYYYIMPKDLYVGNYIGFKDNDNMDKFFNLDLYNIYFIIFPNKTAYIFSYICGILLFLLYIIAIPIIHEKGIDKSPILTFIILSAPYLLSFVGFFIYTIYEYYNIYVDKKPFDIVQIKADEFIENLLNEITDRHMEEKYVEIILILFSCSFCVFIIAVILFRMSFMKTSAEIEEKKAQTESKEYLLKDK